MQRKYHLAREAAYRQGCAEYEGLAADRTFSAFWAEALGADSAAIKAVRKSNSNQLARRTWRSQHGLLQMRIQDTALRARLYAWIDRLRMEWR